MPTGVIQATSALITTIGNLIYQNSNGEISGDDAQQAAKDIVVSMINRVTDRYLMNLRSYDSVSRTVDNPYRVDECCVRGGIVWICNTLTYGTWNAAHWTALSQSKILTKDTEANWRALATATPTVDWIGVRSEDGVIWRWNTVALTWEELVTGARQ